MSVLLRVVLTGLISCRVENHCEGEVQYAGDAGVSTTRVFCLDGEMVRFLERAFDEARPIYLKCAEGGLITNAFDCDTIPISQSIAEYIYRERDSA